jgi:hypothetical protein
LNDHLKKKVKSQEEEETSRIELPQLIHTSSSLATQPGAHLAPASSKLDSSLRKSPSSAIGEQIPRQLPPLKSSVSDKNSLIPEDSLAVPLVSPLENRNSSIPLDWFDDTEKFETRSPDLWVQVRSNLTHVFYNHVYSSPEINLEKHTMLSQSG